MDLGAVSAAGVTVSPIIYYGTESRAGEGGGGTPVAVEVPLVHAARTEVRA
jgi:hypothetical protein